MKMSCPSELTVVIIFDEQVKAWVAVCKEICQAWQAKSVKELMDEFVTVCLIERVGVSIQDQQDHFEYMQPWDKESWAENFEDLVREEYLVDTTQIPELTRVKWFRKKEYS